jgi:hypothetical protein
MAVVPLVRDISVSSTGVCNSRSRGCSKPANENRGNMPARPASQPAGRAMPSPVTEVVAAGPRFGADPVPGAGGPSSPDAACRGPTRPRDSRRSSSARRGRVRKVMKVCSPALPSVVTTWMFQVVAQPPCPAALKVLCAALTGRVRNARTPASDPPRCPHRARQRRSHWRGNRPPAAPRMVPPPGGCPSCPVRGCSGRRGLLVLFAERAKL